jgi:hypothetical protein
MKTVYSLLLLIVTFAWSTANAQDYVFKVLANRGENQVKTQGTWKPVKTGTSLKSGDELKVSENAYVGLVHTTGKTYEIKNAGLVDVNELASSLNTSSSSVASKYADFVMNKINEGGSSNRLAATGAVTRGDGGAISVFMPSSVEVLNPNATISWEESEGETYVVTLKNMFDEVIYETETSGNSIDLDFNDAKLKEERLVIFNVGVKGSEEMKSGDYGIQRLSGEDAKPVMEELEGLKGEVSEESALSYIMMASFYENNNLLVDALTAYESAIKMAPDVEDFKTMRDEFIVRNNLNK